MYVKNIAVYRRPNLSFVLFLLRNAFSVFPRFTDSDYFIGIFNECLAQIEITQFSPDLEK